MSWISIVKGMLVLCLLGCWAHMLQASEQAEGTTRSWEVDFPEVTVQGLPAVIRVQALDARDPGDTVWVYLQEGGAIRSYPVKGGLGELPLRPVKACELRVMVEGEEYPGQIRPLAPWMSVLPPLLAIVMALLFREVYSALFIGLLIGTSAVAWSSGWGLLASIVKGFLLIADTYLLEALYSTEHLSIILFSMLIGGMVQVISANGGMKGVVAILTRFANTPRSAQLATWLLGIAIFFDDYANTLVVGNTMRPVTDRFRISREKLAYIVDSTAAPVASIAFITTWIGAELSYIQDGVRSLGIPESPYAIFLNSLPYSFYPILTLVFVFMLIRSRKDFGPMLHAQRMVVQGRSEEEQEGRHAEGSAADQRARWYNAVVPVLVVVAGTIAGLVFTGLERHSWDSGLGLLHNLSAVIGAADSFRALLWASLAGLTVALLLSLSQRLLSLGRAIDSVLDGFKTLLTAVLILVLAWALARITEDLHTAEYLADLMVRTHLSVYLVPALTFVLAALVSFSTGSSWGTMAILYPLLLPASWMMGEHAGLEYADQLAIFHNTVSAVLAGSVLGDHCSPISDTTILSSLASGCDHVQHVRTQLPYALTVGVTGLLAGTIPAAYGLSPWISFPLSLLIFWLVIRLAGRAYDG